MHAVVATVHIDHPAESRPLLKRGRVQLVQRAAGIVSGYWLEPINGQGMSIVLFDTKEHAEEAAAYPVPPMPGVSLISLEVREVYAHF